MNTLARLEPPSTQLDAQIAALDSVARVELVEAMMLSEEQVEIQVEHFFTPGIYMRHGTIKAGVVLIGHLHKTEHMNILFSGEISVVLDGEVMRCKAPAVFKCGPGVRKIIYAHDDSVMANVHGTTTTDLDKLEDELVIKSETHQLFQQGIKSDLMVLAGRITQGA